MYNIYFYNKKSNEIPVLDFISNLTIKEQAQLLREITLVGIIEEQFRGTYFAYVSEEIFELNIKIRNRLTKVFYFVKDGDNVIILNGFTKKTKVNPPQLFIKAYDKKIEYFKNKNENSISLEQILNTNNELNFEYEKLSVEYNMIRDLAFRHNLSQMELIKRINQGVIYITKDMNGEFHPNLKLVRDNFGKTVQLQFATY